MGLDHQALMPEQQERLGQAIRNRMRAALWSALLLVIALGIGTSVASGLVIGIGCRIIAVGDAPTS